MHRTKLRLPAVADRSENDEASAMRRQLALAQERLEDVTRLVSDWIWETNATATLTAVSARVTELLGRHPLELVGHPLLGLGAFVGTDPAPFGPDRRAPFRDQPFRMAHRDGSIRLFLLSGLPVFSATGEFTGFRGTARDVTAETAAWEEAAESRRCLAAAIDSISEGFSLFDAEDRLVLCNENFRAMLPHTQLEMGMTFADLLRAAIASGDLEPPASSEEWIERRLASRAENRPAFEMRVADGRWFKCSDRRTVDGSIVGVRTDITELKRRESALTAAKETAEIASRSKSEFLANVSHELRTPLNAIIGFTEMMRAEIYGPVGSDHYRSYLGDVLDSAQHLLGLINDILDVAKAEAGKLDIHEDEVDVERVINAAVRLVQERALKAAVSVSVEVPEGFPLLWADERKIKQVLLNLLTNSVKFTPAGGHIAVVARRELDGEAVIEVADTGIGIAPEDIPTALSPFGQVDSKLSRRYEGTGLGLPLSRAMVELHGGRLTLTSTVGVGTVVAVRLPAARVRA